MSETNNSATPEELVEEVSYTVEDASVIPTPIDPTLSISGEAADAKATGDAIVGIASTLKVNGKSGSAQGEFTIYAGDIKMSDAEGAQDISAAFESIQDRTAEDITYKSTDTATIAEVTDEIITAIEDGVPDEDIDAIFEDWEDYEE